MTIVDDPTGLRRLMETALVVQVGPEGTARDVEPRTDDPDYILVGPLEADGSCAPGFHRAILDQLPGDWAPVLGHGPVPAYHLMPPSQTVEGSLAAAILAEPGLYRLIAVDGRRPGASPAQVSIGWMVAHRPLAEGEERTGKTTPTTDQGAPS